MNENGVSQSPNITESNIKNNAKFITNIFDSDVDNCKEKVRKLVKNIEK